MSGWLMYLWLMLCQIPQPPDQEVAWLRFERSAEFLDAAINSMNSFTILVKKEAYRSKVSALNNPVSAELGFSLETEVQTALKPLLAKARHTNPSKFNEVVSSLLLQQGKAGNGIVQPVFGSLMALVGNLAVQEKRITKEDLDSFILVTSRYFIPYEKLNRVNAQFNTDMSRVSARLNELQFDLREFLFDLVLVLYEKESRTALRSMSMETLYLKYLSKDALEVLPADWRLTRAFPADGIKWAKEITRTLQKLFDEYQKIYADNYQVIRGIVADARQLGKSVNVKVIDASLKELELLYNESRASDVLGLRMNTLNERLRALVETEQQKQP